MHRTSLRLSVVAPVVVLSLAMPACAARAQQPEQPPGVRVGAGDVGLTIRGILSASLFLQDGRFGLGNGQQSNFVQQELEGWWHGGDVRNMRLTFDFRGPEVTPGWRVNANFEADLFGGFNGAGNFGDEQPVPRLRLAYADLTNGRTTLRVGQAWALTWGNIPVSTSHIGFPWGWGSGGLLGWRFPGVFFLQSLTPTTAGTRAQLQLALMRGSWVDEAVADQPSAGEAGTPQLEARLNLDGRMGAGTWGAYIVGHWDRKDLNNVRAQGAPEPAENNLDSWAAQIGARVQSGALTLHGNAYTGKAMGHHFGQIIQFGDVAGWGAWAQGGLDLTQRWSLWLFFGAENPDDEDLAASATTATPNDRVNSWLLVPMLRYRLGPYSLGLEWLFATTEYRTATGTVDRKGNQLLFSARFDF